jgi:hypothetical protein
MPIVTNSEQFASKSKNILLQGKGKKEIPADIFPTVEEWRSMSAVEKVPDYRNLEKAADAGALWEITIPLLLPLLSEKQVGQYENPGTGIVNLTIGINHYLGSWFSTYFGINPRSIRTFCTVRVVRIKDQDTDEINVRAFIIKTIPEGVGCLVDTLNAHHM